MAGWGGWILNKLPIRGHRGPEINPGNQLRPSIVKKPREDREWPKVIQHDGIRARLQSHLPYLPAQAFSLTAKAQMP